MRTTPHPAPAAARRELPGNARRSAGARLLSAALLAAAAAGCSGTTAGGSAKPGPPPLGPVPSVTAPEQVSYPTDPYRVTPEQARLVLQAQDAVMAECMRGFGFTARPTIALGVDEAPVTRLTRSGLYGYFDVAGASTKGYDTFVRLPARQPGTDGPPPSAEELSALNGDDPATRQPVTRVGGRPVPPGGCAAKGREAFRGEEFPLGDAALPDGGPKIPAGDARLTDAYAAWSTCMKDRGFDYPDPMAALGDPRWHDSRAATPNEIATATADIACKLAHNTVGVLVALQSAYDKQYLEAKAAELAAYRQRKDDLLRRAAQVATRGRG
ncbi:hypothetical protein ACIBCA_14340 [Kitasatospora sp. NPDC051170]|uniref:hypothetical protein n=1 Tax=Kitasatospora sp. NPDC051170 TaxID=3364056 RepID=UPI003798A117